MEDEREWNEVDGDLSFVVGAISLLLEQARLVTEHASTSSNPEMSALFA